MLQRLHLSRLLVTCLMCSALSAASFAASPRLSNVTPRGVQRGQEVTVSFNGSNLGDAEEIFFYESKGFEVTKLEPAGNSVKAPASATCSAH